MSTQQLTREQAIAFYESGQWRELDAHQIVALQMSQNLLCVPFDHFQQAVATVLGRPVYTHEFASSNRARLQAELDGKAPTPSLIDIMARIPGAVLVIATQEPTP